MKKVIITLMALGSFAVMNVNAQVGAASSDTTNSTNYNKEVTSPSQSGVTEQQQQSDLIKIRSSELPAMVTSTLGNSDYQGWTVVTAYRTTGNDQYKVDVRKGTETKSYWFDKNGNKIESGRKTGMDSEKSGSSSKSNESGNGTSGSGSSGSDTNESGSSSGTGTSGTGNNGTSSSGSGSETTPK